LPAVPSVSADFVSLIISLGFMFWVSFFKKNTNTTAEAAEPAGCSELMGLIGDYDDETE